MSACGLDFGTSNSGVSRPLPDGVRLVEVEDGATSIPSAVFFATDPPYSRRLRARRHPRIPGSHARPPDALAEEPARQQPHGRDDGGRRSRYSIRRCRDAVPAHVAHARLREQRSSARPRGAGAPGALRRRRRGARPARAGHAGRLRAGGGLSSRRIPARAHRCRVRLRAHDRPRGSRARHRRRRRHRRLHRDPPVARPPARAAPRRPTCSPTTASTSRAPTSIRASTCRGSCRTLGYRSIGPRGFPVPSTRLLRPVHVASHQSALCAEVRRRRCANCARSLSIRHRTTAWST